ncbi:proline-rich extensin-like protein EPR1 isoform X2 [Vespula squamosa]|uniref:Proline-rich extensin-like protein EPR1 isoform X2 n=1 Tax=Vespula squamosa TaxID=30214 RepID=A0ABD1ZTC9_VESSQ
MHQHTGQLYADSIRSRARTVTIHLYCTSVNRNRICDLTEFLPCYYLLGSFNTCPNYLFHRFFKVVISSKPSWHRKMYYLQITLLWLSIANVICDLPPGTRRNTYLPPESTKGYSYEKPPIPFSKTPTFPTRPTPSFSPTRTTPPFNTIPTRPNVPPTPSRPYPISTKPPGKYPTRPPNGYPPPGPKPTPIFPEPGNNGNTVGPGHDHHHHEPGMPFDFNYAVKEDAFGNDYSHNAISDGDIVRGEYRVQLPDGRMQIVRYTADWKHGFSAQVSYDGASRNFNRGY